MTRKFRHKPTGWIYEKDNFLLRSESSYSVPFKLIENDPSWEEIKPEPDVPPGIVAFKSPAGNIKEVQKWMPYEDAIKALFSYAGYTIHTINVNGVEYSVGDKVCFKHNEDCRSKISGFEWMLAAGCTAYSWSVKLDGSPHTYSMNNLLKYPTRKPVVTLQGKDMYEGDKYWEVDPQWNITELKVWGTKTDWNYAITKYFSTKELAEKYIRESKPIYPEELINKAIELGVMIDFHNAELCGDSRINILIDKLKKIKP